MSAASTASCASIGIALIGLAATGSVGWWGWLGIIRGHRRHWLVPPYAIPRLEHLQDAQGLTH
jgi:hypothetical protein